MSKQRQRRPERRGRERAKNFMAVTAFMIALWQFVISDPVSGPWFASLWGLISGHGREAPDFLLDGAVILCRVGPMLAVPYFLFFYSFEHFDPHDGFRIYLPEQIIEPSVFWLVITVRDWADLALGLTFVLLCLFALLMIMPLNTSADTSDGMDGSPDRGGGEE
ncbi:hypothetical protein ACFYOK_09790 [Microbispora bryophytorum]|uniref:hypothetical protein n=1 Tax=Microbispora bryophytorum TaxID=1460882 RepID=UPI0033D87181